MKPKRHARENPGEPDDTIEVIRRLAIVAMFSDDVVLEHLSFKGGNALTIVHGIGGRSTIDLDFSLAGDFADIPDVEARVKHALEARFGAEGYVVFDYRFQEKPNVRREGMPPSWGGYEVEFKVVKRTRLPGDGAITDRTHTRAETIGPGFTKTMTIQISRNEFTVGAIERELDDFTIVVYTPEMIAIEKLRAICQQMPEYALTSHRRARSRDFYDIHQISELAGHRLDTRTNVELMANIFAAKNVPLRLLERVRDQREFHRTDWHGVAQDARGAVESFDLYFDYVLGLIEKLEALRNE